MTVEFRSIVTGPDSSGFKSASTVKYHAADKHITPPNHFILILRQPVLL